MAAGVLYPSLTMSEPVDAGQQNLQPVGTFIGTPEIYFAKRIDNSRVLRVVDPKRQRELALFAGALSVLLMFAMIYVWQHFSAIEYGYRMEAQKQQLQQLEEQNHQLRLTEAQLSEPGRIDTMARNLGLTTPHPGQVVHAGTVLSDGGAPVMARVAPAIPPIH